MIQAYAIAMLVLWLAHTVYFYRRVQDAVLPAVTLGFFGAVATMIFLHIAYWLIMVAAGLPF